jgi:hypothetical protein
MLRQAETARTFFLQRKLRDFSASGRSNGSWRYVLTRPPYPLPNEACCSLIYRPLLLMSALPRVRREALGPKVYQQRDCSRLRSDIGEVPGLTRPDLFGWIQGCAVV